MQALLSALLLASRPQPSDSTEQLHQCGKHGLTVVVSSISFLTKLEQAASPTAESVLAICSKELGNFNTELLPTVSPGCCCPYELHWQRGPQATSIGKHSLAAKMRQRCRKQNVGRQLSCNACPCCALRLVKTMLQVSSTA